MKKSPLEDLYQLGTGIVSEFFDEILAQSITFRLLATKGTHFTASQGSSATDPLQADPSIKLKLVTFDYVIV